MNLFITKLIGSGDKLYVASEDINTIRKMVYDENPIHVVAIKDEDGGE